MSHFIPVHNRAHIVHQYVSPAFILSKTTADAHQCIRPTLGLLIWSAGAVFFDPFLAFDDASAVRHLVGVVGGMFLHGLNSGDYLNRKQLRAVHLQCIIRVVCINKLLDGDRDKGLALLRSLIEIRQ